MNAMTSYGMSVYPDGADPSHLHMDFYYNGEVRCEGECMNPFYGNTLQGHQYIGNFTGGGAGTWYVVDSIECTIIQE